LSVPDLIDAAVCISNLWNDLTQDVNPRFRWPAEGNPMQWEGGQGTCLGWEPDGRLKVATGTGIQRLSVGEIRGLG
jgi:hypothetical protein